jgi:hypothetical protein
MPRVSIQQFRATLASLTDQGAEARAYRELARRPQVAASRPSFGSWVDWPPASAPAATI